MSTLIAVHNSDGCVGRCDAKCYDAAEPECDCVCGGRNHGAGRRQAMENTRALAGEWIEQWKKDRPGEEFNFEVPALQRDLFVGDEWHYHPWELLK